MGWLFIHGYSRQDLIESRTKGWTNEKSGVECTVLKHCTRGNVLWTVNEIQYPTGETKRFIGCDLLQRSNAGWGYKGMEESMGPFYYTCPILYLVMVKEDKCNKKIGRAHV